MRFDILTLFPAMFDTVFSESIVGRAQKASQVKITVHNIRDYALDKHHITDDAPYGGGGGMVLKPEPILGALEAILDAETLARHASSSATGTSCSYAGATRVSMSA